jgi:MOSC domain-containing protein YiiM
VHVERDDVGQIRGTRIAEREALDLAPALRDEASGARQVEEPAQLGPGVGDSGLEADPVELPETSNVRGDGASNPHRESLDCRAIVSGRVESIHVALLAGSPMGAVDAARAVPGRGLEGDRYFSKSGTYSAKDGADREITLIESEALEALDRDYGIALEARETRRNVATRGVALNHLVGREFRVGEVTLFGLRLCEPCGYMEELSGKPVRAGLVHRAGLRARILTEGWIRVGDSVEPAPA